MWLSIRASMAGDLGRGSTQKSWVLVVVLVSRRWFSFDQTDDGSVLAGVMVVYHGV